jgi:predicted nuclease of predicted toxin-antitoxin system
MKFLANENIPLELVKELKNSGYDILRIDEFKKGMEDRDVLDLSFKEDRILITFDKDFGKLAVKEKTRTVGIILLRIQPKSIQYIKDRLLLLFEKIKELKGKFIVVEEDLIRERKLSKEV